MKTASSLTVLALVAPAFSLPIKDLIARQFGFGGGSSTGSGFPTLPSGFPGTGTSGGFPSLSSGIGGGFPGFSGMGTGTDTSGGFPGLPTGISGGFPGTGTSGGFPGLPTGIGGGFPVRARGQDYPVSQAGQVDRARRTTSRTTPAAKHLPSSLRAERARLATWARLRARLSFLL